MNLINQDLYNALKEAGASEGNAQAAAQADTEDAKKISSLEARLAIIEKLQWVVVAGIIGLITKDIIIKIIVDAIKTS